MRTMKFISAAGNWFLPVFGVIGICAYFPSPSLWAISMD